MRLEKRRVLSVNGTFAAGTLTVDITAGGVETANLRPELDNASNQTGNFFLDENANGLWDGASEIRDAFTNLRQVIVNGFTVAGPNVPGGTLNWFGDFSNALLNLPTVDVIDINNVANVNFDVSSNIIARGSVNIDATNSVLSGVLDVANRIDINVDRFEQNAGATLRAGNDIDIDVDATATIDGHMRSTSGSIFVESLGSGITMSTTGELIADVGSVKMQASAAGADIVADSIFAGRDVLVRAADDVTLNAAVTSDTGANAALLDGHIHINAGATITSSALLSAADGSVLLRGTNVNLLEGGDLNANLGLFVEAGGTISIASDIHGEQDVLIRNGAITITATGSVVGSQIGFIASSLSIDGTIDAINGVAIFSNSTITMTGSGLIDGTNVAMNADGNIALGQVVATNAIIRSSLGSITDNNGTAINVQANTLLLATPQGSIGSSNLSSVPDANPSAIDIQVGTLSAISGNSVYVQQATGNLTIGRVDTVGAGVNPLFFTVPFNGTAIQGFGNFGISLGGASDLTAIGPIKIRVDAGTLTVTDGTDADGIGVSSSSGDILLWGENGLNVQSRVVATNGDITFRSNGMVNIGATGSLQADDTGLILANSLTYSGIVAATNGLAIQTVVDLTINSTVTSTNGSITLISTSGNVIQSINLSSAADFYVGASQNYTMAAGTSVTATGNVVVNTGGDVNLRQVSAANVAINAGGNILDADADESVNVVANDAILNANNSIGSSNPSPHPDSNALAIDLDVDTISTRSGVGGTYLRQIAVGGDISIGTVDSVAVTIVTKEVKFNSSNPSFNMTAQPLTIAAQENAESAGVFKLVTENGSLNVNDGNDADGLAVIAANDILLESRNQTATGGDVVINGSVRSGSGHVTFNAADDVIVNATVSSAESGTLYINAGNNATDAIGPLVDGVNLDASLTTAAGDMLITSAQDIRQTALISSDLGNIGLIAAGDVTQTATGDVTTALGDVLIEATIGTWTMADDTVISVGGGDFYGLANGDIALGQILMSHALQNRIALQSITSSIVDTNAATVNIAETVAGSNTSVSLRAGQRIGNAGGGGDASDLAIDLNVDTVAAAAASGIHLREIAAGLSLIVDTVSEVNVAIEGVRRSQIGRAHV